jgi:hypothetical protein
MTTKARRRALRDRAIAGREARKVLRQALAVDRDGGWLIQPAFLRCLKAIQQRHYRRWARSNLCRGDSRKVALRKRAMNQGEDMRMLWGDPRAPKPKGILYYGSSLIDEVRKWMPAR